MTHVLFIASLFSKKISCCGKVKTIHKKIIAIITVNGEIIEDFTKNNEQENCLSLHLILNICL